MLKKFGFSPTNSPAQSPRVNSKTKNESKLDDDDIPDMSLEPPFWKILKTSKKILICGCGGGFDLFQGLPLYFTLQAMKKEVHLFSYAFTATEGMKKASEVFSKCYKVTSKSRGLQPEYFPEGYLSQWFEEELGQQVPIYTFTVTGCKPLLKVYESLTKSLNIDTVILIDGGSDSLMKGNEEQIGTVEEDFTSLFAVHNITNPKIKNKLMFVQGLGVDRYHGVSDCSSLRAIAELTETGGFLGSQSLLDSMEPVKMYRKACKFVFDKMPKHQSIVATSILAAIAGHFGDYHTNPRTRGTKLFINPLMSVLYGFNVSHVVERIDEDLRTAMEQTENRIAVINTVRRQRAKIHALDVEDFPSTHDFGLGS